MRTGVCVFCGREITHGGTPMLDDILQWFDSSDDFMCPDGEKEHRPITIADHIYAAMSWSNVHGPQGIGCPFGGFLAGVIRALCDTASMNEHWVRR